MTRYIIEIEKGTVKIGDGECQQIHHYHEDTDEGVAVLSSLADFVGIAIKGFADNVRTCSECGKKLKHEGFVISGGEEYYCSSKCLHKNYTKEQYGELYEQGEAYWTQFGDE